METKKILWYNLAFMAFSTVWGFGNVLNGFVYFNGLQVIFSWVLMFALYFVPYALMVGELGSAFKDSGGGVSSWIHETIGSKSAYYAGWTGAYYGIGDSLKIIYSICNAIGQFSTLVLSIDAPLRMLLDNEQAREFIPKGLLKKNKYDAYINGIWMVVILSGAIIVVQAFGDSAAGILKQLTDLNSVCMPLRYLWVFAAYIALRKAGDKFHAEYRFTKNQKIALIAGCWCFFVTAACCLLKMYSDNPLTVALNVITPIVLTLLGLILPVIKKNQDAKAQAN